MMGKELALKVKDQSKAKMCNVLTCKSDPEIINHIKDMIKPIEVLSFAPNLHMVFININF
jgi:hypothetical protein